MVLGKDVTYSLKRLAWPRTALLYLIQFLQASEDLESR